MYDKSVLTKYKAQDATAGTVAWNAYVAGDWTAGNTARRLATGKDDLILDITKSAAYQNASDEERAKILADAKAVTESNGSGGRSIFMIDQSGKFEGDGAYWNMAVTLQHEAYRDGIKSWDNKAETYQAVLAHTLMAMKLDGTVEDFMDQSLLKDIDAYKEAMKGGRSFASYVEGKYSSDADFWKVDFVDGQVKYGFERDKLTSFTFTEEILGSVELTKEEKEYLKLINGKEFSKITEAEKGEVSRILTKLGGSGEISAEALVAKTKQQSDDMGSVIKLGLTTARMLTQTIKISQADFISFGSIIENLKSRDLFLEIADIKPALDGLEDLGDGTVRPFKIFGKEVNKFTTLPLLRFDPIHDDALFENELMDHRRACDLGGYQGRTYEDTGYFMGFDGSATYGVSEGSGNLSLLMKQDEGQWQYQFFHNSPETFLEILENSFKTSVQVTWSEGQTRLTLSGLQKGEMVGQIGNTGKSAGTHIHGEIIGGPNRDFKARFKLAALEATPNAMAYSGYPYDINIETVGGRNDLLRGINYIGSLNGSDSLQLKRMQSFMGYYGFDNLKSVYTLIAGLPGNKPGELTAYLHWLIELSRQERHMIKD